MVFLDKCSGMGLLDHTGVLYFGERELTGIKQLGINSSYWQVLVSFLGGSRVKICLSLWRHKRCGLDPGLGRSLGVGNDSPLKYSCLENSMDRGA